MSREVIYMKTISGTRVYVRNPNPDSILLDDIAHGLAFTCRWNGQITKFFSVAEHCWRASYLCIPEDALLTLLHDSPEAYIGDMIRPVKYIPEVFAVYKPMETKLGKAIATKFGLETIEKTPSAQMADDIMLISECKAYRPDDSGDWCQAILANYPGQSIIELPKQPWGPEEAKIKFLERFHELTDNKYK